MGSNTFGTLFRITTWGESHGPAIGVTIDGCLAGISLAEEEINAALEMRRPGNSPYTSPRKEPDRARILSGLFEGKTTGAPLSIVIENNDADSSKYEPIKDLLRPGHANYTYLAKYGTFDYRGGGRASARETACRVAAGAVAKKLLDCTFKTQLLNLDEIYRKIENDPDDSFGGVVECAIENLPIGLGEPVYDKLEARLAYAMLSIPATKGFEIGAGFAASAMRGSEHNAPFTQNDSGDPQTSEATLGGISTGAPLTFRVAFKPTSSIKKLQETCTLDGSPATFSLPEGSRHDPCVAIRAVPVVEAMAALVLADAALIARSRDRTLTDREHMAPR